MTSRKNRVKNASRRGHLLHEVEAAGGGAVAGAVLGSIAGPPGAAAGAVMGGVAGALAESALEVESARQSASTRELDLELGVMGDELGAPDLEHLPARAGTPSAASSSATSGGAETPPAGPLKPHDE